MLKNSNEIMKEQFKRRSFKYKMFFMGLLFEKYLFLIDKVPNAKKRAILLRDYYFLMRYIDDIVDKDIVIGNYSSSIDIVNYLEEKLDFITVRFPFGEIPKDEVEIMIAHCHKSAEDLGFSMEQETEYIIRSLLFDAKRFLYFEKEKEFFITTIIDLERHFYDLDIIGTIGGSLKIFDENLVLTDDIKLLGMASRKYYNIRDFIQDIKVGLINIPSEDINMFGIDINHLITINNLAEKYSTICEKKGYNSEELMKVLPTPILDYLDYEISRCEDNLNLFLCSSEKLNIRRSTKLTLNNGFGRPIIKYMKLTENNKYSTRNK